MELLAIATNYGVPIVPIMREGAQPFGTFSALRRFRWVRPAISTPEKLVEGLKSVIEWASDPV
jgi:hypothetical protein